MPTSSPASAPARILVRGVNWLGDAVMTTPALMRLREALPGARITLLSHEKIRDLWQHHPAVDQVIPFASGESFWRVGGRLRREGFDVALVLPNSPRSALEPWWAKIPRRIGYARPWRDWLLTERLPTRPGHISMRKRSRAEIEGLISIASTQAGRERTMDSVPAPTAHQMHEYLHLAATLGGKREPLAPVLRVTTDEIHAAEASWLERLRQQRATAFPGQPLVCLGLNPSAAYGPAKRWPVENFAAVAREVARQIGNCAWFVFGSANDADLGDEIARRAGESVFNLAGKTPLRELMALLKICRVLLTNDSGPMHVAAALGTPVVVPFGSTSPELTGPGLPGDPRHQLLTAGVPCAPCFLRECPIDLRCLRGVTVERVTQAVLNAALRTG